MKKNPISYEENKINSIIRRKTVLSFSILLVGFTFAIIGWKWINKQPQVKEQPKILRNVLNSNTNINALFFSKNHLAREYPKSRAAKKARVNGDIGMDEDFDPAFWKLSVIRHSNKAIADTIQFDLKEIQSLPKREVIFNFKCIEGWSQISYWGGVRFSDFMAKYHIGTHSGNAPDSKHPEDLYKYVGLITPDGEYYVGIDMKSMMHPQTLLCYELNAMPLPMNQGYPLRLIITVKYGIKNLKRIGYIYFSDSPPRDYWYEHGYDYDAAL
jgi:hypothetical protein